MAAHSLQRQRNPDVSLMLVYVATLLLSWLVHGPWRDPEGSNFPQSKMFADAALLPILMTEYAAQRRLPDRAGGDCRRLAGSSCARAFVGFQMRVAGLRRGRQLCGHLRAAQRVARHADRRRVPRASPASARSPGRSASCCRRCRRATASRPSSSRSSAACIRSASCSQACSCRCCTSAANRRRCNLALPSAVTGLFQGTLAVLPARRRRVHQFSRRDRARDAPDGARRLAEARMKKGA